MSLRVLIGLAADQPLEANFFPGILEGLAGRLGLVPPSVTDPPTSVRAGMSRQWVATLREAVRRTEGISTSSKSRVLWCLPGSIWTMTWISEPGGLMT